MVAKLYTADGLEKGTIDLPSEVFQKEINQNVLHAVITSYNANKRQGTAKTKTRTEVSGGGKKPYRQKGTGRARAGSNTSPVWVRGGKAFGAVPRSYGGTIPKKLRKIALVSAYSARAAEEQIKVVEDLSYDKPHTKSANALITKLSCICNKNLLLISKDNHNVYLSARNIRNVSVKAIEDVTALDILTNNTIIFSHSNLIEKVKEVVLQ